MGYTSPVPSPPSYPSTLSDLSPVTALPTEPASSGVGYAVGYAGCRAGCREPLGCLGCLGHAPADSAALGSGAEGSVKAVGSSDFCCRARAVVGCRG